jgi:signal transduction histidine kinase
VYQNFFKLLITLSVFYLGFAFAAVAQQRELDSLHQVLNTARGLDRYNTLYQIAKIHSDTNVVAALSYIDQAYDLAMSLGDSANLVKAGRVKGIFQTNLNDLEGATSTLNYVLGVARRNEITDQLKFVLNTLAITYTYKGNYDKALDYNLQSLVIREQEGNKSEISIACNNIGLVYIQLSDYERALEYFKRSLQLKEEVNDTYDIERCMINIGICYNNLLEYSKAIEHLNEALALCEEGCQDAVLTEGHFALGQAYLGVSNIEGAKRHLNIGLEIAQRDNNKRFETMTLTLLHSVSLMEKDTLGAFNYLKTAESILDSVEYNSNKRDVYQALADLYVHKKAYREAAYYQDKYIRLNDSILNDQVIRNLARVQTKYEERENIATIAAKEQALVQSRRLNLAVAIIAVMTGLLVFVLYRSNLVKKRVNKALSAAKETIEIQNKQLTSLNRNLERMVDARTIELQGANEALKRVNDELDNFIYKTSHDIRGPLASLKGMCNVAIMDVKDPLALEYFQKLDATAEKLNTILTRLLIINQINNSSASYEPIDFNEIVEDVIILEKKRGLPPKLNIRKSIENGIAFYSDKELVRIILENLIDNAIKFYNDSDRIDPFVEIRVERDGNYLKLRVIDNGIGISQVNPDKIFQMFSRASERSGTGGIGLYLTKTATEKIGGQIDLKTTPEGHTEFFVKFSLSTSRMRREVIA